MSLAVPGEWGQQRRAPLNKSERADRAVLHRAAPRCIALHRIALPCIVSSCIASYRIATRGVAWRGVARWEARRSNSAT